MHREIHALCQTDPPTVFKPSRRRCDIFGASRSLKQLTEASGQENFMTRLRLLVVSLLFVSLSVYAQTPTGQISGNTTDESGGSLPGVTVTAQNKDTGFNRSTVTNSEGSYVLPLLPAGNYEVTGELAGFQTFKRPNVVVNVGSDVTVPIPLRVGVQETITVSAEAP